MADEDGTTSIAARIAALKLDQVARQPSGPPPSYQHATTGPGRRLPPTLPNKRPDLHARASVNVPIIGIHPAARDDSVGNLPAGVQTNGRITASSGQTGGAKSPPQLPSRPSQSHSPAPSLPPRRPTEEASPQLPPRRLSESPSLGSAASPSLPPRRPSQYSLNRRGSAESTASALSTRSSISAVSTRTASSSRTGTSNGQNYVIRAPAYDPASLPPLPPKRQSVDKTQPRASLTSSQSSPVVPKLPERSRTTAPPPPLPTRGQNTPKAIVEQPRAPVPKKSALSFGMNEPTETPPALTGPRPSSVAPSNGTPPPIPKSSRPDLAQLQSTKPKTTPQSTASQTPGSCLRCRDFSAVDAHAARFPRESIPSTDLSWLSHQLTSPFPSLTDKARVIFTWLHHNIDYNTVAFYSGNLKPSTPASTIATGLAVCEGYASLFAALATTSGLEALVVGGHGKGAGYVPSSASAPLPPFDPTGHAWNAVRIDNDAWKLLDACWGAGHVNGPGNPYKRSFSPWEFTKSNDDFGRTHYPSNPAQFFRDDGRPSISWKEYLLGPAGLGEAPQMFGGCVNEEGIDTWSFTPVCKQIDMVREAAKPYVRFSFAKVCPHWVNEVNGKGRHYCYVLHVEGTANGGAERKGKNIPFETNGSVWWVDIRTEELGQRGDKVRCMATTGFDKRDGRGITAREYEAKEGKVAMGWTYCAEWEVV